MTASNGQSKSATSATRRVAVEHVKMVAVIPAYNEERFIGSVVLKARQHVGAVIVVDDGSSDHTAAVAAAAGAQVIRHRENGGKGAALSSGFRAALALEPDVVITLDADGQHLPAELGDVARPVLEGEADIVIGSPRHEEDERDGGQHALARVALDWQSGFCAFSPAALRALSTKANGYCPASQLQLIAQKNELRALPLRTVSPQKRSCRRRSGEDRADSRTRIKTSIIVPAYNEEEALPHVLVSLNHVIDDTYEVIVVDDGSSDATRAAAQEFSCRVLYHETNMGKGAAMQTGIQHAQGEKVIFIDGDATYPVDVIPDLVASLDEHDLVRAVRASGREMMPRINQFGNRLFEWAIAMVHRVESADALTGLYGLRRDAVERMRLQSNGFDIESEIVIKAGAMGLSTHAIPIVYAARIGEKKLRPFRDGMHILTRIIALAALFNPFLMYVLPGLALWSFGAVALLVLGRGPLITGFAGLSTNSLIVGTMTFLSGFQLVVFGLIANLYAIESGLGVPSRSLHLIARHFPRLAGAALSMIMIVAGGAWALALMQRWVAGGFGPFHETESLIISLALTVWGVQLLCTMFFLSLFAGQRQRALRPS